MSIKAKASVATLAIMIAVLGLGLNKGGLQLLERPDSDKIPPVNNINPVRRVIVLKSVWSFPNTGRIIKITYWRDNVAHPVPNPPREWTEEFTAEIGEVIKIKVDQIEGSGFLQCSIIQDEVVVAYQHWNGGNSCYVKHAVV